MAQPLIGRRYLFDPAEEQNYEKHDPISVTVEGQGVDLAVLTARRTLGQDINAILGVNQFDGSQSVNEKVLEINKLDAIEKQQLLMQMKGKAAEIQAKIQKDTEAKKQAEFQKLIDAKVAEKIAQQTKTEQ